MLLIRLRIGYDNIPTILGAEHFQPSRGKRFSN
jgi:hypothetical protein